MTFTTITNHHQIEEGDLLLIKGVFKKHETETVQFHKVKLTKTLSDGTAEIILAAKDNVYFNLHLFLNGMSWVREIIIVKP